MWDIKGQSATLVWDIKEHSKAVTCFTHFEPGDSLLSGSADKTIRVNKKFNISDLFLFSNWVDDKNELNYFSNCSILPPTGLANG